LRTGCWSDETANDRHRTLPDCRGTLRCADYERE
jgi:hypothetical protein